MPAQTELSIKGAEPSPVRDRVGKGGKGRHIEFWAGFLDGKSESELELRRRRHAAPHLMQGKLH